MKIDIYGSHWGGQFTFTSSWGGVVHRHLKRALEDNTNRLSIFACGLFQFRPKVCPYFHLERVGDTLSSLRGSSYLTDKGGRRAVAMSGWLK